MPPQNSDPATEIWLAIFRKAPVIGACCVLGLVLGCVAVFYFADSSYRILAVPYLTIPLFLVGGFIVGVIADTCIGLLRGEPKKKKKPRHWDGA